MSSFFIPLINKPFPDLSCDGPHKQALSRDKVLF